jgi:hypothetical protein
MVERQCATQRCSPLTGLFTATVGKSVLSANRAEFPSFRVEFPSFGNWRRDVPATEPRATQLTWVQRLSRADEKFARPPADGESELAAAVDGWCAGLVQE